jgi:hypothetical protein
VDFELTLLYRGSEQEFTHDNFKRLVGNQGPTLHIIKSQHDYLFGGCAFEKYPNRQNGSDENKEDAKAFLFQLHPNQVKLKNKQEENSKKYAIRCYSGYLSLFGGNSCDFQIGDSIKDDSKSYLGNTYELPQGYNQE